MEGKIVIPVWIISSWISVALAQPFYTAVPIESPMGAVGRSLNNYGQVAGDLTVPGQIYTRDAHAFIWDPVNGLTDLGAFPDYNYSQGWGINDQGWIVGDCMSVGSVWYGPNQYITMGTLVWPCDINNQGQVTGKSRFSGIYNAFLWQEGRELLPLGSLGGPASRSYGNAVNEMGQIVGFFERDTIERAFFWEDTNHNWQSDPGEMIDLGSFQDSTFAEATDITDYGLIVGYSGIDSDFLNSHAFWTTARAGEIFDLGTLGGTFSYAAAANNLGQIVGRSLTADRGMHAFISGMEPGSMIDLNDLLLNPGPVMEEALDINDLGQILVRESNGGMCYLLIPVPEPASVLLFLTGIFLCRPQRGRMVGLHGRGLPL